jgi:hypothetical protein
LCRLGGLRHLRKQGNQDSRAHRIFYVLISNGIHHMLLLGRSHGETKEDKANQGIGNQEAVARKTPTLKGSKSAAAYEGGLTHR